MQQFQAAEFSEEVSRLAAAPRRPSTICMCDDRWLHFSNWAAEQGIDLLGPTAAQVFPILPLQDQWPLALNDQGLQVMPSLGSQL